MKVCDDKDAKLVHVKESKHVQRNVQIHSYKTWWALWTS